MTFASSGELSVPQHRRLQSSTNVRLPSYATREIMLAMNHAKLQIAYETVLSTARELASAIDHERSPLYTLQSDAVVIPSLLDDLSSATDAASCEGFDEKALVMSVGTLLQYCYLVCQVIL